jgi:hypothetical protein
MIAASAPTPVRIGQRRPATQGGEAVRLRLWAPLTPLFWLLSPFAVLLAPLVWVWLPRSRRPSRPFAAVFALGRVLVSLSGTVIEIDAPDVRLFIRIF